MILFQLDQRDDEAGVTGVVAQGVEFDDGTVAMRWLSDPSFPWSDPSSTAIYKSMSDAMKIHGHGGKTVAMVVRGKFDDELGAGKPVRYRVPFENEDGVFPRRAKESE